MEETSSTLYSSTNSSDTFISLEEESEVEVERVIDIFDILYDSESESLQEEEPEYVQRKTLEEEPDFFTTFSEVPKIEDIVEDVSVVSIPIVKPELPVDTKKDVGKFVNPLTGLELEGSIKSSPSAAKIEQTAEEEPEKKESLKDEKENEDSDLPSPKDILDEIEEEKQPDALEDSLAILLELEKEHEVLKIEEIDWEALALEEENQRVFTHTMEFITDLISKAVDKVELGTPDRVLRQSLDKRKLLKELLTLLPDYNVEKKCCEFLNRQVTTYYKRKSSFRNIMAENPKTLLDEKQKFYEAREHLDKMIMKEKKLLLSSFGANEELLLQYKQTKEAVENLIKNFENEVKKNLSHDNKSKLSLVVDQLLMQMQNFREEISEVRFSLITKQHTYATLNQYMTKLEDIGKGLNINDFYNLQAKTQALDKKLEERNNELSKLYARCRNDVHGLAHFKDSQKMISHNMVVQTLTYDSLLDEKILLRQHLFFLKVKHTQLKAKINELSYQGGLLDKPALMHDYDDTVKRCHKKQKIVNNLRQTVKSIEMKIDDLLKQCPNVNK